MKTDDPQMGSDASLLTPHGGPFVMDQAACNRVESAVQQLALGERWQIEHIALNRLVSAGQRALRYLVLHLDVFFRDMSTGRHAQLCLTLSSEAWQPTRPFPSPSEEETATVTTVVPCQDEQVNYRLAAVVAKPQAHPRATAWLNYVQSPLTHEAGMQHAAAQYIACEVGRWLQASLNVTSVAGAETALLTGAVGSFGPVEPYVLERSGQADLAVDATLLGSADDAQEHGGEPTRFLTLYGERFGRWLLHRRTLTSVKPARKDLPSTHHWQTAVVIATTREMLIAQCELTPSEKRLFQSAGILPHATLFTTEAVPAEMEPGHPASETTVPDTALNLSDIADRPRRHLLALAQLVQQGRLDATDTDLLLKTARQLSKANAVKRPVAKPTAPKPSAKG